MWNLSLETHRYLIEPLGGTHLQTMLYSRFTKYIQSINTGIKDAPIYLLNLIKNDTNTITGRNIKEILNLTNKNNIFDVKISDIKKCKFREMPENEKWRTNILKELTNIRMKNLEVNFDNGEALTKNEIDKMLFSIATM